MPLSCWQKLVSFPTECPALFICLLSHVFTHSSSRHVFYKLEIILMLLIRLKFNFWGKGTAILCTHSNLASTCWTLLHHGYSSGSSVTSTVASWSPTFNTAWPHKQYWLGQSLLPDVLVPLGFLGTVLFWLSSLYFAFLHGFLLVFPCVFSPWMLECSSLLSPFSTPKFWMIISVLQLIYRSTPPEFISPAQTSPLNSSCIFNYLFINFAYISNMLLKYNMSKNELLILPLLPKTVPPLVFYDLINGHSKLFILQAASLGSFWLFFLYLSHIQTIRQSYWFNLLSICRKQPPIFAAITLINQQLNYCNVSYLVSPRLCLPPYNLVLT